jgi:CheY-like chemotaxis protein
MPQIFPRHRCWVSRRGGVGDDDFLGAPPCGADGREGFIERFENELVGFVNQFHIIDIARLQENSIGYDKKAIFILCSVLASVFCFLAILVTGKNKNPKSSKEEYNEVGFSAFYPREVNACTRYSLIFYAHLKDGRQAKEILSITKDKIYVLILDQIMPNMDGFRLIQYLSNRHPFHVGIVMHTGYGSKEAEANFFKSGSEKVIPINFLNKPTQLSILRCEVVAAINQIWEKRNRNSLIDRPDNLICEDIQKIIDKCQERKTSNDFGESDLIATLTEIMVCFSNNCYLASIALCGRSLEIYLKRSLISLGATFDDNWPIGALINKINEIEPGGAISLSAINNISNIINKYRIAAVHSKSNIAIPTRASTIMVLYGMIELLNGERCEAEQKLLMEKLPLKRADMKVAFNSVNKKTLPMPSV